MPATQSDLEKVQAKRKAASESVSQAQDYKGASYTLQDDIMNAVRDARAGRGVSGMAQMAGDTSRQLVTDPADIRARTGDMVNPMTVDQITAQARGQNLGMLATQATQESRNTGSLEDIIGAGANRMRSQAEMYMAQAQRAAEEANALMERLQFEEQVRQFNESLAEQQRQFDLRDRGGGSGSGIGDILAQLFGNQEVPGGDDDGFIDDGQPQQAPTQEPPGSLGYIAQSLKEAYMPEQKPFTRPSGNSALENIRNSLRRLLGRGQ